jgi:hypothetical protein
VRDNGDVLWVGWAFLDGHWHRMAEAQDIGTAHHQLLAATAGMKLSSGDRFLTTGGKPPVRPQDGRRTARTTSARPPTSTRHGGSQVA